MNSLCNYLSLLKRICLLSMVCKLLNLFFL